MIQFSIFYKELHLMRDDISSGDFEMFILLILDIETINTALDVTVQ